MENNSSPIIWDKKTKQSLFTLMQEVNRVNNSMVSRIISLNEDWKKE